ncbi:MAG: hypothetical protein JXJ04_26905 [Spirochaetales bacterium]|nr:hypothetical protein [Spirochaetales bacterium]
MEEFNVRLQPRPKKELFIYFYLIVLLLFVTIFLWIIISHYKNQVKSISLRENRFLTTEWRLLRELKAETDQKLLEKEQEIADLSKRYLELAKESGSDWELRQIEIRLEQAKAEREKILSQQTDVSTQIDQEQKTWFAELLPTEKHSALIKYLQEQNDMLNEKIKEAELHITVLEKKMSDLNTKQETLTQEYTDTIADNLAEIKRLSALLIKVNQATLTALEAIKQKSPEIDKPKPPSIEELNTWALVRALIASPEIKAEYPELLTSLDQFFASYGLQEQHKGRREAYAVAETILRKLIDEMKNP